MAFYSKFHIQTDREIAKSINKHEKTNTIRPFLGTAAICIRIFAYNPTPHRWQQRKVCSAQKVAGEDRSDATQATMRRYGIGLRKFMRHYDIELQKFDASLRH
ncbi:hypothetical protein [Cohnella sp. REN36]|uniref:hypothetical protein n=1 Tax=Cohnella sp. REN36 TaxID=2887347 RepID=UPI001D15644B|nr:hypothetical protein [Cohnella sp. REN36]MCC3371951.1 hypothetical protein [Cohnella sp. REN36]